MRPVSLKCALLSQRPADQQARAVLFRARERIVHQRTELVNALRAVLYEYGQVIPQGIAHIKRIEAIIENAEIGLPELVQKECRDLLVQISEKTARIEEKTKKLGDLSRQNETARRLQTMPGVGPLTALAVEAFAPAMQSSDAVGGNGPRELGEPQTASARLAVCSGVQIWL
ncbi:hypothetical protein [Ensifer aridi]|uniref:hypothetical protein n=1 Tax=Ensifer aridi TaxID=1708715 RepID=UPI001FDAC8CA|nr:hypothetical protein [Ensifer aridi]